MRLRITRSETPFGLTLGNYKTFVSSTPNGGVRGLWDADSDRLIFGTHQIVYRLGDRRPDAFPHDIERKLTFLPYAQISEFSLDERIRVAETFYVPHGPAHERTVSFIVEVTLHNRGAQPVEHGVFPTALLSDCASTASRRAKCGRERGTAASATTRAARPAGGAVPASRHAVVVAVREQMCCGA